jgi:hypothetical protein
MKKLLNVAWCAVISLCVMSGCLSTASQKSEILISMDLVYQHKDTSIMACNAGFPPYDKYLSSYTMPPCNVAGLVHNWNCATANSCVHCLAYCAPASVAMIAEAYGKTGALIQQDSIYDNGKSTPPEISGNGTLETHAVGMFDGSGGYGKEVQAALTYALEGMAYDQHDSTAPLDVTLLNDYIVQGRPVLWLDHNGWPQDQGDEWPPSELQQSMGHAKVIAGFDDMDTPDPADDLCLIYDPWPSYTQQQTLPPNALKGPGETFDPYWLPQGFVLGDASDIFLVPTDPVP